MNCKKTFTSLFFLFILLISIVSAQEDFTASTKGSVELCPCSNQAYTVNVENTGSIAGSYAVLASGDVVEWVTFSPDKFVLAPGQKGSFFVSVNSECNIKGDYDLEIFITANNGLTKVVNQVLDFAECYDYSLEQGEVIDNIGESARFLQHDNSYILCRDEKKSIPILITNNEDFENQYRLFLDAPEWAGLNIGSVSLSGEKSGLFFINYDATDIDGQFDFKLNTISELGKVQRKKNIEADVQDCYALELELEKEKDTVCGGEEQSYEITLKNPVTFEKNVKLESDSADWASFGNRTSFDLKSGDEETAILNINPGDDVSGSFLVLVSAVVENKTRVSSEIKIDVTSKFECYKATVSTKASITNLYSKDFFSAKVKNDGIKKADYDVSLEGPSWVSANPGTLELNPGQTGNINLNVNPGEGIEQGTYGIKINLESEGKVYPKNVDIVLKKESESVKKAKLAAKVYQYYIYLLVAIIVLIVVFRKQIIKSKNKIKKRYEKYKVKSERLKASRLARKEKEEEKNKEREQKKKEKELDENKKEEKARKEKSKETKKQTKKKFKISLGKTWIYVLLLIALGIFVGHQNRLFNAKYLHLYIKNIFVGYFYYISIGVGVVVVLFLLLLFYNYISKEEKKQGKAKKRIKKEAKKSEKKTKKKKEYSAPYFKILTVILLGMVLYSISYFNLIDDIKDFFVLYQLYIMSGIAILVAIILIIRFYKPLFKFLK
jgi:Na+-transporting methylmalonyl-CoA/oxaloacetate decarboxylase gamma subunit